MKKIILFISLIVSILFVSSCGGGSSACEHYFELGKTIEPTCTTRYQELVYYCKNCDYKYSIQRNADERVPHDFEEPYIIDGTNYKKCKTCGFVSMSHSVSHPHKHNFYTTNDKTNSDCNSPTYRYLKCECGFEKKIPFGCKGHVMKTNYEYQPTCIHDGHSQYDYCINCDYRTHYEIYPALGHNYVNGVCNRTLYGNIKCGVHQHNTINFYVDDIRINVDVYVDNVKNHGDYYPHAYLVRDYEGFLGWYTKDGKRFEEFDLFTLAYQTTPLEVYAKFENEEFNPGGSDVEIDDTNTKYISISTKEEFLNMDMNLSYKLENDINLGGIVITPFENFKGILDGNGYSIKNFIVSTSSLTDNYGLFKVNNGKIKNITFKDFTSNINVNTNKGYNVGIIVGKNNGVLENIKLDIADSALTYYVTNPNSSTLTFGNLVGYNKGEIINSISNVNTNIILRNSATDADGAGDKTYQSYYDLGGLVGKNDGSINYSTFTNTINVESRLSGTTTTGFVHFYYYINANTNLGGLVGKNSNGSISNSYTESNVYFNTTVSYNSNDTSTIGGLVGLNANKGKVETSYSTGKVKGGAVNGANLGGLVGANQSESQILNSYSSSSVTSGSINNDSSCFAGLVAKNDSLVYKSYSNGTVTSTITSNTGGFVGLNNTNGVITNSYTSSNTSCPNGYCHEFAGNNLGSLSNTYYSNSIILIKGTSTSNDTTSLSADYSTIISHENLNENLKFNQDIWHIGSDIDPFFNYELEYGHDFSNSYVVEATCDTIGYTYYVCNHCDKSFLSNIIPPTNHETTGDKIDYLEPTHEQNGYKKYNCVKGHIYTVVLPALGHDVPSEIACDDPNITIIDGTHYYKCSCEELIEVNKQQFTHTPINIEHKDPSCGVYDNENNIWLTNPTNGITEGIKCEKCNKVLSGCELIKPHNYELVEVITEATCISTGEAKYKCTLCEYQTNQIISETDHTYVDGIFTCIVCNADRYRIDASYIPINNYEDLLIINLNPSGHYYLANDINLNNINFEPLCSEYNPFTGILLGNGHKITNLTIQKENSDNAILGFITHNEGVIAGVTFENVIVNVTNILKADVGIITTYNNGVIYMCTINNINVTLTSTVINTLGDNISKEFKYNYGSVACINNESGIIDSTKLIGNAYIKYNVEALLKPTQIADVIMKILNTTSVKNKTHIVSGGICSINYGSTINTIYNPKLNHSIDLNTDMGIINRGKAYTDLTLNDGSFIGINYGIVKKCSSIARNNFYHTKDENHYEYEYNITIKNVIIKLKNEKLYDTSVYEDYQGIIGLSKTTGDIIELSKIE